MNGPVSLDAALQLNVVVLVGRGRLSATERAKQVWVCRRRVPVVGGGT